MNSIKERWGCSSLQLRCPLCLSTVKGARQLATLNADEVVKATSIDALSCSVECCIGRQLLCVWCKCVSLFMLSHVVRWVFCLCHLQLVAPLARSISAVGIGATTIAAALWTL